MSNLVPCKDCGHQVSRAAISCPSCGVGKPGVVTEHANPPWIWPSFIVSILALCVLVLVFKSPSSLQVEADSKALAKQLDAETKTSVLHPLLAQSDDFSLHQAAFIVATRQLIKSGRCTTKDFKEMGGWLRSTTYKDDPIYFTYCGGLELNKKVYLNARTGEVI